MNYPYYYSYNIRKVKRTTSVASEDTDSDHYERPVCYAIFYVYDILVILYVFSSTTYFLAYE